MNPLTREEMLRYRWCLDVLDDEHVMECQNEAELIAIKEARVSAAYSELLPLLVKLRVAEIEAESQERIG